MSRLARLRELIESNGGPVKLAKRLGYSNASYLVQMAGPTPIRPISERTARSFEEKLGLPVGWMDQGADDVAGVIRLVGMVLDAEKVNLPQSRFAKVVALVYEHPDQWRSEYVKRLLELMK